MSENYDGQYEITIVYDTTPTGFSLLEHTLTFDVEANGVVEAGTPFGDIRIFNRENTLVFLDASVDAFVAGMLGIYPASATIIRAELNHIPEGTYAKTFISSYPIDEPGIAAGDEQPAHQTTFTFRSIGGGSGRLQFMESVITLQSKTSYPYATAAQNAIADLVTDSTGFIQARDNTFMFANLHMSCGQNERLWRKRYRN